MVIHNKAPWWFWFAMGAMVYAFLSYSFKWSYNKGVEAAQRELVVDAA